MYVCIHEIICGVGHVCKCPLYSTVYDYLMPHGIDFALIEGPYYVIV